MKPFAAAALLLALGTPALAAPRRPAPFAGGTPVSVTVTNQRFVPDRITLRRGRPYVLTIRNTSDRKHNFSAGKFFGFARVAPRDAGWVTDNKVDLAPGQVARLHIVAPDTPNAVYEYRSTNLLDAAEKMKGTIYVR